MLATITIRDRDADGFLKFDLAEILQVIAPFARTYRWSILWLRSSGQNVAEIEREVASTETGLVTDWLGLLEVSKRISQTYDGLFVATDVASPLPILVRGEIEPAFPELVVEALDSSYWVVAAREHAV